MNWTSYCDNLTERGFRRRFKITKMTFADLVEKLGPSLTSNSFFAILSSGSATSVELNLAATLRWLAGSNFLDIEDLYLMDNSTFYKCVLLQMIYALDKIFTVDFDISSFEPHMETLSQNIHLHSKRVVSCCIAAIDGMAVKIGRPSRRDTRPN
eukprot:jgi/Tetstr1/458670/TSEL_045060.t1